jgi:hypothetical protein
MVKNTMNMRRAHEAILILIPRIIATPMRNSAAGKKIARGISRNCKKFIWKAAK